MSTLVSIIDGQAVTTSVAIANGTDVEHASVMKLVRAYQEDFEAFGRVGFEIEPFETAGGTQRREIAILNEQQSTLLMTLMRNSEIVVRFKVRLVKEFWQLTKAAASHSNNPASLSRMQLIELAMQAEQERLMLEEKVQELAPKAQALDRMTLADGEVCLQTAGKLLQQPPNKFIAWLRSHGTWIFKRHGSSRNSAYTDKINAGYLNVRTVTTIMPDGRERVTEQVVVTPKGLVKLAQMLGVSLNDDMFGDAA